MATPRSEVVQEGAEAFIIVSPVASVEPFLCGYDQYSGRSYAVTAKHGWKISNRLTFLLLSS